MFDEKFAAIESAQDPVEIMKRTTELLLVHQQLGYELVRRRKKAIYDASEQLGLTYSEIANNIGVSVGRVGQLRQSGPPEERIFFGYGPVNAYVGGAVKDKIESFNKAMKYLLQHQGLERSRDRNNFLMEDKFKELMLHVDWFDISKYESNSHTRESIIFAVNEEIESINICEDLKRKIINSDFSISRTFCRKKMVTIVAGRNTEDVFAVTNFFKNNLKNLNDEHGLSEFFLVPEISLTLNFNEDIINEMIKKDSSE